MPEKELSNSTNEVNFDAFLTAVRDYDGAGAEVRTTAHSSSVTTSDWQRIQDAVRLSDGI